MLAPVRLPRCSCRSRIDSTDAAVDNRRAPAARLRIRSSTAARHAQHQFYPASGLLFDASDQDIRGYPTGQYRDRRLLTAQAEYRLVWWKRFGLVAFGGWGEVARTFDAFTWDDALPSGGAGIRFRLTRQNTMNLRADYAWGRRSDALYVSVGEAF